MDLVAVFLGEFLVEDAAEEAVARRESECAIFGVGEPFVNEGAKSEARGRLVTIRETSLAKERRTCFCRRLPWPRRPHSLLKHRRSEQQ